MEGVNLGPQVPPEVLEETLVQLMHGGYIVRVPRRWLIQARGKHGGKLHGFVALKPLKLGDRDVVPGDILGEQDETPALEGMLLRHEVAELPLEHGVLALVLAFQARVAQLESQLAPPEGV